MNFPTNFFDLMQLTTVAVNSLFLLSSVICLGTWALPVSCSLTQATGGRQDEEGKVNPLRC